MRTATMLAKDDDDWEEMQKPTVSDDSLFKVPALSSLRRLNSSMEEFGMNEVIPRLWLGDLSDAQNTTGLAKANIGYVLSVMRGPAGVDRRLVRYQIEIDDTEYSDLLVQLPPAISFLTKALQNPEGKAVLVHCLAGMSRSPSIVATYLMYTQGVDLETALSTIRMARPIICPNNSFMKQLEIFHSTACKVSVEDRATRAFYLERAVKDVIDGQRSASTVPLAEYNASTSDKPRRRIRCKMCRQELASYEHMMPHGTPDGKPELKPKPVNADGQGPTEKVEASKDLMEGLLATSAPEPTGALGVEVKQAALDAQLSGIQDGFGTPPIVTSARSRQVVPPPSRPPVARPTPKSQASQPGASPKTMDVTPPPPPLISSTCSGYWLEPMKWMDPVLTDGRLEGKILCPNTKCNAKLGNFDWSGLQCNCGWVTPGFCVHKSKVDEIW